MDKFEIYLKNKIEHKKKNKTKYNSIDANHTDGQIYALESALKQYRQFREQVKHG